MSAIRKICLLGLGEVGSALVEDLASLPQVSVVAWDRQFTDPESVPSRYASTRPYLRTAPLAENAASGCQLVISAVTAAQDRDAALSVLPGLERDAWFLDLNSVSPRAKQNVAEIVHAAGARYVEAVIMSPIAPARVASRILLGGPHAREFGVLARGLGFAGAEFFDENIGRASATKMCRSVIVKGMEALLLEALLAARAEGVDDEVLASLGNVFPHPNWPAHAHYLISRALQHGARRAEEMREAARTVADAGIAPWMAEACASRQQWAAQFGEFHAHSDLHALLDEMRAVNATGFAQERKSR